MKDIRELDFIDRIAILVSSVVYILGMSFGNSIFRKEFVIRLV